MATDVRLTQLARILDLPPSSLTPEVARAVISARAEDFADELFVEAANNDDVTSIEAALDYLESRLADFGDLVEPDAAARVRAAFGQRLSAWG
jgi:hypothetical protein